MKHIRAHDSVVAKKTAPQRPNKKFKRRGILIDSDDDESVAFDNVCAVATSSVSTTCPPRQDVPPPPPSREPIVIVTSESSTAALPECLRMLGNKRAWEAVRGHLVASPSDPFLLSGPTGCGKTAGIVRLLESMHLHPVMLDGVEADDTQQLITWIKRTRDSVSFGGKRAVVVDDLEGFTEKARDAIVTLSRDNAPGRAPLVLVVNNARDPLWKRLNALKVYRMFPPNEHVAFEWFKDHQTWQDGARNERRGFNPEILHTASSVLACGDLRRIRNHLVVAATTGLGFRGDNDSFPSNIFEASRRLYRRTISAQDWATFAEPRDVHLLQYHTTNACDDIHRLSNALDTFSSMDAHRPARYEHTNTFDYSNAHTVAASTRVFTNPSRDVGALSLPPPPNRGKRLPDTENPVDALNRCGWR